MNDMQAGIFWIILTVFCEARDQPPIGQKNVAKVIMNRAQKKNWPLSDIVLSKKQFSCYNKGFLEAMSSVVKEIKEIAKVTVNVQDAIDDWLEGDTLAGATHYYAFSGPNKIEPPYWAASMKVVYKAGDHIFLREG